jgi:hypothetical protein
VLAPEMACDPQKGLSAADPRLVPSLGNYLPEPLGSSTVCEANQLELTDLVNGDCVAAQRPGWCLIARWDAGLCLQAIHRSPPFGVATNRVMYATCWSPVLR